MQACTSLIGTANGAGLGELTATLEAATTALLVRRYLAVLYTSSLKLLLSPSL